MKAKPSGAKPKRDPSDLTRTQWKRLKRLLPPAKPGGRPREVKLREILNGIFSICRGGCSWRISGLVVKVLCSSFALFAAMRFANDYQYSPGSNRGFCSTCPGTGS